MIVPLVMDDVAWYGPATVTFAVQFPGDPFDPVRNDVRVQFIGDKNQREERMAYFDPGPAVWRATLYAKEGGSFRAVLVRNGQETLVDPEEGIVQVKRDSGLGILPPKAERPDRWILDTGEPWIGIGSDLGSTATSAKINALADAGASWVRLIPPMDDNSPEFGPAMEAIERRGLAYTLAIPTDSSPAWRRYALARYGSSARLVQWEVSGDLADPWARGTTSTAVTWDGLFQNRPGPFTVKEGDLSRIKALQSVVFESGWATWKTPRIWSATGAKGVGESDRMILVSNPGAKLIAVPLADGTYDLTTIDPATGSSKIGETRVQHATLTLEVPSERFFVLRRRL